jgi:N-acyl-D-amino-acid deacylase
MAPSAGVRHVLVNGRLALRDGAPVGSKSGLTLKRSANMPSRPQHSGGAPSVFSRTANVAANVTARNASFRFSDPQSRVEVRLVRSGKLQAHQQWASFTGIARISTDNQEHAIVVIFDGPNPDRATPSLVVEVDDGRRFEMILQEKNLKVVP